jgi:hypothetical protein
MKIILAIVTMVALIEGPCYAQINAAPQGKTGMWSERIDEGTKKERKRRKRSLTRLSRRPARPYQSQR